MDTFLKRWQDRNRAALSRKGPIAASAATVATVVTVAVVASGIRARDRWHPPASFGKCRGWDMQSRMAPRMWKSR